MLDSEIYSIHDTNLRSCVQSAINACAGLLEDMPATTTGKHHPPEERGPGGVALHVARMVKIVNSGLARHLNLDDLETDLLLAAIILHDIGRVKTVTRNRFGQFERIKTNNDPKFGDFHEEFSVDIAAEFVKPYIDKESWKILEKAIRRHMGSWIKQQQPESKLELALSILDYVDSREFVHVDVD